MTANTQPPRSPPSLGFPSKTLQDSLARSSPLHQSQICLTFVHSFAPNLLPQILLPSSENNSCPCPFILCINQTPSKASDTPRTLHRAVTGRQLPERAWLCDLPLPSPLQLSCDKPIGSLHLTPTKPRKRETPIDRSIGLLRHDGPF